MELYVSLLINYRDKPDRALARIFINRYNEHSVILIKLEYNFEYKFKNK